jgi:hypothetical protein
MMLVFPPIGSIIRDWFFALRDPILDYSQVEDLTVNANRCRGAVVASQCACRSALSDLGGDEMVREVSAGVDSARVLFLTGSPPLFMLKAASTGIEVGSPTARFLSGVRERASELLERKPLLGEDYAIAEVLSCGYYDERPGHSADEMTARLRDLVERSSARVIVAMGNCPQMLLRRAFQIAPDESLYGPFITGEYTRFVTFLPHPLAARSRSFDACLTLQQASRLKSFLAVTALVQEYALM